MKSRSMPPRIVVSLGDNGVVTEQMLRALRRGTLGTEVVLVTPRVPDEWGPEADATIRAATRWWPTLRIADWEALSAGHDDWFTDGVHPDRRGIRAYVGLVTSTLDGPGR